MSTNPVYICIPTTKERAPRLEVLKESLRVNAGYPYILCTYENFHEGFVAPIHKILSGLRNETLVWCIGDDTELIESDTLARLVDAYMPGCVVQPDDGIHGGRIATMPLCNAKTMRDGTFEGYFLNSADVEFTTILQAQKRYIYCSDIKLQHSHHINNKAPEDDTYRFAASKAGEDAQLFSDRCKINFNNNKLLNNE